MKLILILGHTLLNNGKASNVLKKRLHIGIEAYQKGDIIIVSGGKYNKKCYHSEAYIMKKYLLLYLPNANILMENKSISTEENITNCRKIIDKDKKLQKLKVLVVTSNIKNYNHFKKVERILKKNHLNWEI